MKKVMSVVVVMTICWMMNAAFAQVPHTINYQGYVTNSAGTPLNATMPMTFRLYTTETGGTALWTETQNSVTLTKGVFNVLLGSVTPMTLDFSQPYWLETVVNGETLSPRRPLVSVGYAFRAEYANNVNDADADPNNELNTSLTLNSTTLELTDAGGTVFANLSSLQDGNGYWLQNEMDISYDAGNVGIGTTSPNVALDVKGSIGLEPAPVADQTANGFVSTVQVDENTTGVGAALHLNSDGNYVEANATALSGTLPCSAVAVEAGTGQKKVLHYGYLRNDSWNWVPGGLLYVSNTDGVITQMKPSVVGEQAQILGIATHADRIFFNPDYTVEIPHLSEFYDNFESYAIGYNPTDVYDYYYNPDSWGGAITIPPDYYEVVLLGTNQVLKYDWVGSAWHIPTVYKMYKAEFTELYEAGATFLQQQSGWNKLHFAVQDDNFSGYEITVLYDNNFYVNSTASGSLSVTALWGDTHIMSLDYTMKVVRDGHDLIVSITRLDTNDTISTTVTNTDYTGGRAGFGFAEDVLNSWHVHVDDFYVKGIK